ncbi:MAG: LURP-one-related family protein [Oscillospiraceae bacterium]|nr:LURP-one-related family protein [Oscillospiraceae bacterium]
MKLYIKQRVFSFADRFAIKDEHGNDVYSAVGRILSLGKKLDIYEGINTNAAPVGKIEQRLMSITTRFGIIVEGHHVTDMVRKITFFSNDYRLEGLPWHLEGDFLAHEYSLMDGHNTVMRLSRKWFTWGDSYELDIADGQDPLLCLCIALAVDCCMCVRNN